MTLPEYCARQAAKALGATVLSITGGIALGVVIVEYLKKRQATNVSGSGASMIGCVSDASATYLSRIELNSTRVKLIRDEVANMVWGIERRILLPVRRHEARGRGGARAVRHLPRAAGGRAGASKGAEGGAGENPEADRTPAEVAELAAVVARLRQILPPDPVAPIRYVAMNTVREQLIPFVPGHVTGSAREIQLKRAAMSRILTGDADPPKEAAAAIAEASWRGPLEPLGVPAMLEAQHEVFGVPDDHNIARGAPLSSPTALPRSASRRARSRTRPGTPGDGSGDRQLVGKHGRGCRRGSNARPRLVRAVPPSGAVIVGCPSDAAATNAQSYQPGTPGLSDARRHEQAEIQASPSSASGVGVPR
jgi:hypothetical protein